MRFLENSQRLYATRICEDNSYWRVGLDINSKRTQCIEETIFQSKQRFFFILKQKVQQAQNLMLVFKGKRYLNTVSITGNEREPWTGRNTFSYMFKKDTLDKLVIQTYLS